MPEYLAPGVYVEEVDTGDKPIEGVSTSTAGMVGVTMRGPVANPTLVTSVADFQRQFGGRLNYRDYAGTSYLPLAIEGFFTNGGKRVYVVRVLPDTAVYATQRLFDRGDGAVNWTTKLASVAAKNDSLILINQPAIAMGPTDWFVIEDPAGAEYVQAAAANPIVLSSPVMFDVPVGAAITGYVLAPAAAPPKLIAVAANAGANTIEVNDVAGINVNDLVTIGAAPLQDVVRVQATVPANPPAVPNASITLRSALAYGHPVGANVQQVAANPSGGATTAAVEAAPGSRLLVVADRTQLPAAGDAISVGAAATEEWHLFFDGGVVTSSSPLNFVHPAGSQMVAAALTDLAAPDRNITADASPGDAALTLNDRTNIVLHTVLRLGPAAGPNEYVVVRVAPSAAGPGPVELTSAIRSAYVHGTPAAVAHAANDTTAPGAASTVLARSAQPNEQGLYLLDSGPFPANTLLRLGTGDLADYHVTAAAPRIVPVTLTAPLANSHGAGLNVGGRSVTARVQAIDRGSWGNCLRISCADDDPILDTAPAENKGAGAPDLQLRSASGIEAGTVLEFYKGTGATFASQLIQKVSGRTGNTVHFAPGLNAAVDQTMRVRTREFRITAECVQYNPRTQQLVVSPGMSETIRQLSMDPRHSRYFQKAIGPIPAAIDGQSDGESSLIRVRDRLATAAAQATVRLGPDLFSIMLAGGDDAVGDIVDDTYIGTPSLDPTLRTGIYAMQNIEEISVVAVPGRTSQDVQNAVIAHCEQMRYRFGVLDSALLDNFQTVQQHRDLYDSKYAAFYYPWFEIGDPFPINPRAPGVFAIPPSGHVVGIYARTDIARGVHKAPANEVVLAIDDLQAHVLKEQQDILNPRNINVVRDFRDHGRGLRVWGARCITSDPDWRYVNVRRLFNFLEHSLDNGTQWVVFEPNDERLWARVRQSVSSFLTDVWRSGALMGTTAEQAFFVKCDTTTMTQGDIDNGRLILVIGVAPVRPAEFVIIRIGQWAGGSMVQEA